MDRMTAAEIADGIQETWGVRWTRDGQQDWIDAIAALDEDAAFAALERFAPVAGGRPSLPEFRTLAHRQAEIVADLARPRGDGKLDDATISRGLQQIARIREQLGVQT